MTDLNKIASLWCDKPMSTGRDPEERRRIDLRVYLQRALYYAEQMAQEEADLPRLIAECNALDALREAGEIANAIYIAHVRPRTQEASRAVHRKAERRDVEAWEERLDQEGFSC
jgi:hypothetical protein